MNLSSCQCDGLKGELMELQKLYNNSQQEREALEQELQRCRAELHKLAGRKSQVRGPRSATQPVESICPAAQCIVYQHLTRQVGASPLVSGHTLQEGFRVQTIDRK